MAAVIYSLCALTSILCFVLLWRSWRTSGARLLVGPGVMLEHGQATNLGIVLPHSSGR